MEYSEGYGFLENVVCLNPIVNDQFPYSMAIIGGTLFSDTAI